MPTLYAIKPRFQTILRGVAGRLAARQVSADTLTAAGLIAAALAGALIVTGGPHPAAWIMLVPPLLFARIACNALDGMVARETGTARRWGGVINEVGDRLADLLCFGGLVFSGALPPFVSATLLPALLLVNYVGIVGQAVGGARCHAGPLGKADRMLLLGAYCCLAPFAPWAAPVLGWLLLFGLMLTVINRLLVTRRDLAHLG